MKNGKKKNGKTIAFRPDADVLDEIERERTRMQKQVPDGTVVSLNVVVNALVKESLARRR